MTEEPEKTESVYIHQITYDFWISLIFPVTM